MRLFIGIPIPEDISDEIANQVENIHDRCRGNYTDPDLYHVTLAFIGETAPVMVPQIRKVIESASHGRERFSLKLSNLGFFGKDESAILWWGMERSQRLESLAACIAAKLDDMAVPYDHKPFRAHLTLGRKINLKGMPVGDIVVPRLSFEVDNIVLFESLRLDGELNYRPIETVSL